MSIAKDIKVLELKAMTVAKINYKGSFRGIGKVYSKLMHWGRENGFADANKNKNITIYHDDPNEVGMNNVRQSACLIIDKPFELTNTKEIKKMELDAGKCAVGRYEISFFKFKKAWTEMFDWVEKNNFKVSDKDAFEIYHPKSNFKSRLFFYKVIVDICIPIQ